MLSLRVKKNHKHVKLVVIVIVLWCVIVCQKKEESEKQWQKLKK